MGECTGSAPPCWVAPREAPRSNPNGGPVARSWAVAGKFDSAKRGMSRRSSQTGRLGVRVGPLVSSASIAQQATEY
jgi:hypothetical protein